MGWLPGGSHTYRKADGSVQSYQHGSWISRVELEHVRKRLQPQLQAWGLGDFWPYVELYLFEAFAVLDR